MIFVALGTHGQPFEHALDLLEALAPRHALVQHGHTPPRAGVGGVVWRRWLAPSAIEDAMRAADGVVVHAGVGLVFTALRLGRCPVLIPRRAHRGEHVDDHQGEITRKLAALGLAVPCADALAPSLAEARRREPMRSWTAGALREPVWEAARVGRERRPSPRELRTLPTGA